MSKEVIDFIKKYSDDVIRSVQGTGIFPSVAMAQMIIESSGKDEHGVFGIGKGLAARKANNYFGIKADSGWHGKTITLDTPRDGKPVSLFRVYASALDSLIDHTQFLLKNSRYKTSGVFTAKTPKEQTEALQRSKYSESPTYGKTLLGLITAYHLTDLDNNKPSGLKVASLVAGGLLLLAGIYLFHTGIKTHINQIFS